jgi:hypothetical protein
VLCDAFGEIHFLLFMGVASGKLSHEWSSRRVTTAFILRTHP